MDGMTESTRTSHPPIGETVARGGVWEVASSVIPQLFTVVQSIFIARYLGPTGVGTIAFISLIVYSGSTLLTLGLPSALLRFTGRLIGEGRGKEAVVLYRWTMRVEAIVAALFFAGMATAAYLGAHPPAAWVFAGVVAAGGIVNSVSSAFLRGQLKWRQARIFGMTTYGVNVGFTILILVLGGGISAVFAIDAITVIVNVTGTEALARRSTRELEASPGLEPARSGRAERRRMVRFAGVSSINLFISLIVFQRTEVFFLAHYSTPTQVAIYSIPFSLVSALILVPHAIGNALAPAVATLWGAGHTDRIRTGFGRATRILLLILVVITSFALTVAPTAIRIVYGEEFAAAGQIMSILTVTVPFVPLGALSAALLVGIGRQWALTFIGLVAVVINLGLDWLLIPRYDAVGAAIANSTAQVLGSVPLFLYAVWIIGGVTLHFSKLIRGVVVAAVAALAGEVPLQTLPLVTGFVLGVAAFVGALLAAGLVLRPIAAADGVWMNETLGHWGNGLAGFVSRWFSAPIRVAPAEGAVATADPVSRSRR
jgi:O-antigen/teichoic acid export membrane protein